MLGREERKAAVRELSTEVASDADVATVERWPAAERDRRLRRLRIGLECVKKDLKEKLAWATTEGEWSLAMAACSRRRR